MQLVLIRFSISLQTEKQKPMSVVASYLLFYCILIPLSILPMRVLYFLSDIMCFVLKDVVKYRKKVIVSNLKNSFPQKSEAEIRSVTKKYYRHLSDLLVEAAKMLTISKKSLLKRYKCLNADILLPYYKDKESIILASAHYNNWEYMVASLDMQIAHHGIGVGKRMSNKTFERLAFAKRTRYGSEVCYADNVRQDMENHIANGDVCAYMLLSDQSPNDVNKCYWANFLNQKTALIYGAEYFAKKYNYPVFFYKVDKVKRGYYEVSFSLVSSSPQETPYGFVVESIAKLTEDAIKAAPEFWLWSHRRWKLTPKAENQ